MQTGLQVPTPVTLGHSRDWENQFHAWGSSPGQREQNRLEAAVKEIRAAIRDSSELANRDIEVFVQGSYRNRVNVRADSDVDVAVVSRAVFFTAHPEGTSDAQFGVRDVDYPFSQFKQAVGRALIAAFGRQAVTPGSKAFDIKAAHRNVEADVAPFFQHRRYAADRTFLSGVEMVADDGARIINWPEQHYNNGVDKHARTHDRFKKVVRILKCLRNEMAERGWQQAVAVPSFLIECLVFNAPNNLFGNNKWGDDVRFVLAFLRQHTGVEHLSSEWGEVSELKYLFRPAQKWTRQQAHDFIVAAESYVSR